MSDTNTQQEKTIQKRTRKKKNEHKMTLPRYLRLAKGGMWRDVEGNDASGKTVYAFNKVMVGRHPDEEDVPVDKFDNKNLREYGFIDKEIPWYIDLKDVPKDKLGRIIIAYKAGVLVKADPKQPPKPTTINNKSEWKLKQDGALIFDGKNKEMYKKLQNMNFEKLKSFINECPFNESGRDNLLDLFDYEKRGFNPLSRPRLEVLEIIRGKLREFGPGISGIRTNEPIKKNEN